MFIVKNKIIIEEIIDGVKTGSYKTHNDYSPFGKQLFRNRLINEQNQVALGSDAVLDVLTETLSVDTVNVAILAGYPTVTQQIVVNGQQVTRGQATYIFEFSPSVDVVNPYFFLKQQSSTDQVLAWFTGQAQDLSPVIRNDNTDHKLKSTATYRITWLVSYSSPIYNSGLPNNIEQSILFRTGRNMVLNSSLVEKRQNEDNIFKDTIHNLITGDATQTHFSTATIKLLKISELLLAQTNWEGRQSDLDTIGDGGLVTAGEIANIPLVAGAGGAIIDIGPYVFPSVSGDGPTFGARRWYSLFFEPSGAGESIMIDVGEVFSDGGYIRTPRAAGTVDQTLTTTV